MRGCHSADTDSNPKSPKFDNMSLVYFKKFYKGKNFINIVVFAYKQGKTLWKINNEYCNLASQKK